MKKKKKEPKERPIKSVPERLTEMLDMPKEVMLDIPKMTFYGDNQVSIENFKGVLSYTDEEVKIKTSGRTIQVTGSQLEIRTITDDDVMIEGRIGTVQYV